MVVEKGKQSAGFVLEAAASDISSSRRASSLAGNDRSVGIMELRRSARRNEMTEGVPKLDQRQARQPRAAAVVFPNGCHIRGVEIDPKPGVIEIVLKYNSVNDSG